MVYNHRGRIARPNRIEVKMSDEEIDRLNRACYELDRSASDITRAALEFYIDRHCNMGINLSKGSDEGMV